MIRTDSRKCLRCSGCVGVCPRSALTLTEHGIVCDSRCNNCKICINFCPVGAIDLEIEGVRRHLPTKV
ncbi:MAG: 4Fe-4S binding protein [Candidatus Aenigmarchaeota archaeon]|nr:4Fe-4S binding protein [Candidatus Aenigmarchaeota archaeon]